MNKNYFDMLNIGTPDNIPKIYFSKDIYELNPEYSLTVECKLYTLCNLKCQFCADPTKQSKINIDYIRSLPDKILDVIIPRMKEYNIQNFKLFMMGGELFQDNYPDSLFSIYQEFFNEIKIRLNREIQNSVFRLDIVTNGIFENYKRVEEFLNYTNSDLTLSYDPIGRFTNDKQREIWLNTFNYFKDRSFKLYITLTKPNIYAYINGDKLFESLGNNIQVSTHYYTPTTKNYQEFLPSDDDIYNFYKWGLDNNKFNMFSINLILERKSDLSYLLSNFNLSFSEELEKKINKSYLTNSIDAFSLLFDRKKFYGQYTDQVNDDNYLGINISLMMQKRGCLYCEYYSGCSKTDLTPSFLFDEYKVTICPLKRAYSYLDNNPYIINEYIKWKNRFYARTDIRFSN